jgi:predicted XRE-type DNA-binding protein
MNSKVKIYQANNASELAELLDLDPIDAIEMEFRARLSKKITDTVLSLGLTHAEVANRAGASRTRVTALLNGNTSGLSTDFLLRILYSLGLKAKVSFEKTTVTA